MSFKIKNSQINNEALECLNSIIDEDINAGAAFKLTRILKFISTIVEDRVKAEQKILDKWAQKDENGQIKKATGENGEDLPDTVYIKDVDAFSKDMSDLLNAENLIPFEKLEFSELGLKTAKIKDLLKIEFLFN
jgi:hypothetical protein